MKKIIITIIILFIAIFAILGGYFIRYKMDKENYDTIKYDEYKVDLIAGKATSDIKMKDINIKNIYIDNRILNFDLIGKKEDIYNKRVEISLINPLTIESYNIIYFDISKMIEEVEEIENGYHISLNIEDDKYNNPTDIRIELK